jgi:hypothetical protein
VRHTQQQSRHQQKTKNKKQKTKNKKDENNNKHTKKLKSGGVVVKKAGKKARFMEPMHARRAN